MLGWHSKKIRWWLRKAHPCFYIKWPVVPDLAGVIAGTMVLFCDWQAELSFEVLYSDKTWQSCGALHRNHFEQGKCSLFRVERTLWANSLNLIVSTFWNVFLNWFVIISLDWFVSVNSTTACTYEIGFSVRLKQFWYVTLCVQVLSEYAGGGSLFTWVRNSMPIPLDLLRHYMQDILSGLKYLHDRGLVHGNLRVNLSPTICFYLCWCLYKLPDALLLCGSAGILSLCV